MSFRRIPTNLDPAPEEVLSAEQLARLHHYKRAYVMAGEFRLWHQFDPSRAEADRLLDRLSFARALIAAGRLTDEVTS